MESKEKEHWFTKIENLHPYQTLLYLGMFGSGLIFLFLLTAFFSSQPSLSVSGSFKMPRAFILSSALLLISAFTASRIPFYYKSDEIKELRNSLIATFLLGLGFTGLQFFGWKELTEMGINFRGLASGSFLYVLSGIHILHLTGAMVFGLVMIVQVFKCQNDEVKTLFLLSNPYDKMKIELFTVYWKYMDIIWLILFFTFLWFI
ncbi:cytochrome c oxidase subunit 3 [Pleomorphovibrio marinus]|uniref:cytochrome c oxidase subunit 3 n=1 Tax=Pleomorphovibrio marinus TaxID=2164132 RepID=UPI000E0A0696|nr:cytochrome c oxidase subunit 3 [Pleomorphovibrio marinus]